MKSFFSLVCLIVVLQLVAFALADTPDIWIGGSFTLSLGGGDDDDNYQYDDFDHVTSICAYSVEDGEYDSSISDTGVFQTRLLSYDVVSELGFSSENNVIAAGLWTYIGEQYSQAVAVFDDDWDNAGLGIWSVDFESGFYNSINNIVSMQIDGDEYMILAGYLRYSESCPQYTLPNIVRMDKDKNYQPLVDPASSSFAPNKIYDLAVSSGDDDEQSILYIAAESENEQAQISTIIYSYDGTNFTEVATLQTGVASMSLAYNNDILYTAYQTDANSDNTILTSWNITDGSVINSNNIATSDAANLNERIAVITPYTDDGVLLAYADPLTNYGSYTFHFDKYNTTGLDEAGVFDDIIDSPAIEKMQSSSDGSTVFFSNGAQLYASGASNFTALISGYSALNVNSFTYNNDDSLYAFGVNGTNTDNYEMVFLSIDGIESGSLTTTVLDNPEFRYPGVVEAFDAAKTSAGSDNVYFYVGGAFDIAGTDGEYVNLAKITADGKWEPITSSISSVEDVTALVAYTNDDDEDEDISYLFVGYDGSMVLDGDDLPLYSIDLTDDSADLATPTDLPVVTEDLPSIYALHILDDLDYLFVGGAFSADVNGTSCESLLQFDILNSNWTVILDGNSFFTGAILNIQSFQDDNDDYFLEVAGPFSFIINGQDFSNAAIYNLQTATWTLGDLDFPNDYFVLDSIRLDNVTTYYSGLFTAGDVTSGVQYSNSSNNNLITPLGDLDLPSLDLLIQNPDDDDQDTILYSVTAFNEDVQGIERRVMSTFDLTNSTAVWEPVNGNVFIKGPDSNVPFIFGAAAKILFENGSTGSNGDNGSDADLDGSWWSNNWWWVVLLSITVVVLFVVIVLVAIGAFYKLYWSKRDYISIDETA